MATSIFDVPGMDCPMEEKLIRDKLARLSGISRLEFNLVSRKLTVHHEEGRLDAIISALASLDMGAELERAGATSPVEEPIPWKRLAVAGVLALLSELLDVWGEWSSAGLQMADHSRFFLLSGGSFIMAIAAIALAGLETYKKGWIAVKSLNLNINALMAVAVTAAVLIGQYPEAAAVIVLFNLSEAIEAKSLDKARKAIKGLMALAPETAEIRTDAGWSEVPAADVQPGSVARVGPGGRIALDGRVIAGQSAVNQAPITGEGMPVEKKPGDWLYAGSINEMGSLEYEVAYPASQSTLARIIHAVESAQATRAPIQRFVDVFARYYTPAVFALAIIIALAPPLFWGAAWHASIYKGLVILIIGCPCALVISTPVSVVSGMAAATRKGILVKGGVFMEQGRLIRWLALDKTGTITSGRPTLRDVKPLAEMNPEMALRIAASLAARSDHPVSRAIAIDAREKGLHLDDVENFQAIAGQGVTGVIDGAPWRLGNLRMLKSSGNMPAGLEKEIASLESEGKTVVVLAGLNGPAALFAVADSIRPGSVEAIRQLKALGVYVIMLTGDNAQVAAAIAAEAGVDEYRAEMLPQDKLKLIESLETRPGKTAMAGDGINDAPALASADISFAMAGEGSDAAIETADVALMDDDLRKIPEFMRLSAATFAILAQNICIALAIKAVFFALALTGHSTMWMAVFADVGAALLVVGNGLRAMRK